MTRPIMDSRFMETMGDYFASLCTVQQDEGVADEHGMLVPDWQPVAGLTDIPCAIASAGGQEVKQPDQTYVIANFKIALKGPYPAITEVMRAVVTGPNAGTYDILLAEGSSHAKGTRLIANEVT